MGTVSEVVASQADGAVFSPVRLYRLLEAAGGAALGATHIRLAAER